MNIRIRSFASQPVDKSAITKYKRGARLSTLDQLANKIWGIL